MRFLKELILDDNEDCIDFFKEIISDNKTVTKISLRQCEIKDNGIILLQEAFA